jgi:predicted amidohydrolase
MHVAAVQLTAGPEVGPNLAAAERLVREAAAKGAQLVVLPEKWHALGSDEQQLGAVQATDGPAPTLARELAAELGIELVAGSWLQLGVDGRVRNTSQLIDAAGEVRAAYSKIHMFDVEVGGHVYRESAITAPGEEIVVTPLTDGTPLGLTVCYDVRFPELYRTLAVAGAQLITIPAAFTAATTATHWEILVRARAIENQLFVIAANQVGEHGGGMRSGGNSMIVDPWGEILARAGDEQPCVIDAELDLGRVDAVRAKLPSLAGRRPDAYATRSAA